MSEVLLKAESIVADITYKTKEYSYLFNAAAFNETTMDWVVVSQVRLTKQDHSAYCLAFSKTFNKINAVRTTLLLSWNIDVYNIIKGYNSLIYNKIVVCIHYNLIYNKIVQYNTIQ